ncbi:MAG TPA: hypothetical protein VGM18_05030 [Candidatus Sulfotelmatobacter sp.]|jgi:hypothetical protein
MNAFALQPFGPPAPCGFPRCTLTAFHDGDHQFPAPKPGLVQPKFDQHCVVCGQPFTVYAPPNFPKYEVHRTCGKEECLLHLARHDAQPVPQMCRCPQRDYPHELAIHTQLRSESFNPAFRYRWPWSLMLSLREEPSTERRRDA